MDVTKLKLSITIDKHLVKWLDSQIQKKRFASRSHAIEFALTYLKK
jgi:Arc/MetJ-type ribon-helix-helix transcriptional regulator